MNHQSAPSRKPDFEAMHPSRAAFEAAMSLDEATGQRMAAHLDGLARPDAGAILEGVFAGAPLGDVDVQALSVRLMGDYILQQAGVQIVPAAHGRIQDLLITPPSRFNQATRRYAVSPRDERHYRALVAGLGPGRQYTVVCHPDTADQVAEWFEDTADVGFTLAFSPRFNYSIWAQDAYVALRSAAGGRVLSEGVSFPRYEDMTIADDIAAQADIGVLQSYLYFQGGNVLGTPRRTLIGADYGWRNVTRAGLETESAVMDRFSALFGTEITFLGGSRSATYDLLARGVMSGYGRQPIFHIDMYVTPTGVTGPSGKEVVFLGRPRKAHEVVGKYSEVAEFDNPVLDGFFDETHEQLTEHFEVHELPLLLTHQTPQDAQSDRYYLLSFNNVVIENYDDNGTAKRNVLMTTYAQDSAAYGTDGALRRDLEDAAEDIWTNLGFSVSRTDGLEDLAAGLGSVHCITKALARTI